MFGRSAAPPPRAESAVRARTGVYGRYRPSSGGARRAASRGRRVTGGAAAAPAAARARGAGPGGRAERRRGSARRGPSPRPSRGPPRGTADTGGSDDYDDLGLGFI